MDIRVEMRGVFCIGFCPYENSSFCNDQCNLRDDNEESEMVRTRLRRTRIDTQVQQDKNVNEKNC